MGEKEDNQIPKGPAWLTSPLFWLQMLGLALVIYFVRHYV